jgi:hypothetical protein
LSSQLGIDKLQLLLPVDEVMFEPHFPATVDKPMNAATGECLHDRTLYTAGGSTITGRKAYYDGKTFQLDIVPHRQNDSSLVLVHFSAAVEGGSNLEPLDLERTIRASREVESKLKDVGCSGKSDAS